MQVFQPISWVAGREKACRQAKSPRIRTGWREQEMGSRGNPLGRTQNGVGKAAAILECPTPVESPCCFPRHNRPVPPVRETEALR